MAFFEGLGWFPLSTSVLSACIRIRSEFCFVRPRDTDRVSRDNKTTSLEQIEKVFRSLQKISLAVRGLYGEGSQAMGDFYQISNQLTLGRSEEELIEQVSEVVPVMIDYERRAREFLVKESQKDLHDRVSRAYGILCTAQTISSEETMMLLSSVRMGVNLGLIADVEMPTINQLFIHTQPAHLQKLRGVELDTADRNSERASYLQRHLGRTEGEAEKN